MALSIINWLFSLICEPDRDRVEDQNLVVDAENSPPGVVLAEGQSFAAFLSQLFSLLSRGLGASPPSIPLMGFPALPASFAREKRPRFVSRRAMEALVKYIRRRARERFREAAAATTEATTTGAAGEASPSSAADLAFSAGLKELAAAKRQAELARLYHRPQRSVMDVMSTEEHLRREAGRGA